MSVSVRSTRVASSCAASVTAGLLVLFSGCGPDFDDGADRPSIGSALDGPVLLINEVLANESGSDVSGEFVELVNAGDEPTDIGGFSLSDGTGIRHQFAAGTSLGPSQAVVVFGGPAGIPSHVTRSVPASSGALGLSNRGDSLILADASGALSDSMTYDASLSGHDGVSMNRRSDGDAGSGFALHTELSEGASSPGTRMDGTPFGGDAGEPLPPSDPGPPSPPGPGRAGRLRVVAANLTSGNFQSYDPGHGIRILQGLTPDVALVSEMNYGSDSGDDMRAFVDRAFGPEFQFTRQDGVTIPCGVVSRFPIIDAGVVDDPTLTDRDISFARIDVPGERDLWAVSVHLSGSSSANRTTAADALVDFIAAQVPARDFLLVGGDFNTRSRTETCLQRLSQVVMTSGPFPVDQSGNDNTNEPRGQPYDWVLADPDLESLAAATRVGDQEFASGLVFDSRVFQPLSGLAPILAADSGAPGMQHMAVVREFEIPAD